MNRIVMRRRSLQSLVVLLGFSGLIACTQNPAGLDIGNLKLSLPGSAADLIKNDPSWGMLSYLLEVIGDEIAEDYSGLSGGNEAFSQCATRTTPTSDTFRQALNNCVSAKTSISDYQRCLSWQVAFLTEREKFTADLDYCNRKYAADGTFDEYETCLLRMERCWGMQETLTAWSWVDRFNSSHRNGPKPFNPGGIVIGYQGRGDPKLLLLKVPNELNDFVTLFTDLLGSDAKSKRAARNLFAIESDMRMLPFQIDEIHGTEANITLEGFTFWVTRLDLTLGTSQTVSPSTLPEPEIFQERHKITNNTDGWGLVDEVLSPNDYDRTRNNILGARIQIGNFNIGLFVHPNLGEPFATDDGLTCGGKMELLVDFRIGLDSNGITLTPIAKKLYMDFNCSEDLAVIVPIRSALINFIVNTINNLGRYDQKFLTLAFDGQSLIPSPGTPPGNGKLFLPFTTKMRPNYTPRHFLNSELAVREKTAQSPNSSWYTVASPKIAVIEAPTASDPVEVRDESTFETGTFSHAIPLFNRIETEDTEIVVKLVGCEYRNEQITTGPWIQPPIINPGMSFMAVPIDQFSSADGGSLDNLPQITAPEPLKTDFIGAWEADRASKGPLTLVDNSTPLEYNDLALEEAKIEFTEEWNSVESKPVVATASTGVEDKTALTISLPGGTQVVGPLLPFDPRDVLCTGGMLKIKKDSLMVDLQELGLGNQIRVLGLFNVTETTDPSGQRFYTFDGKGSHIKLKLLKNPRMTIRAAKTPPRPNSPTFLRNLYRPSVDLDPVTGVINYWRTDPSTRRFESMFELPTIEIEGTQTNTNKAGVPFASWSISGFQSNDEGIELPYGINRDNVIIKLTYPKGSLYPAADKLQLTLDNIYMIDGTNEYRVSSDQVRGVLKNGYGRTMHENTAPTEVLMQYVRRNRQ